MQLFGALMMVTQDIFFLDRLARLAREEDAVSYQLRLLCQTLQINNQFKDIIKTGNKPDV